MLTPQPKPFDVALSLASHARAMGYRKIAVLQSKQSASCYVLFVAGICNWTVRVSDHPNYFARCDFNLPDLSDQQPAIDWMRALRCGGRSA